jgi:type II secretory pathway pseudopilin PulG
MANIKAKSFVLIMVVIAIVALVLRFGIQEIIEASFEQNELAAQATLKLISASLENYAKDHAQAFPTDFSLLAKTSPPYLDKDYVKISPLKGYVYTCPRLDAAGYRCLATPSRCGLTGKKAFTVSTGNLFISEDCAKKEEE